MATVCGCGVCGWVVLERYVYIESSSLVTTNLVKMVEYVYS